jgi:dihydroorotate dehydrogenase
VDAYRLARPLLFGLPAETAHGVGKRLLSATADTPVEGLLRRRYAVEDDRLAVEAFGQQFPAPVGVAAGFDKNARAVGGLAALGFGHVEVGAVTADPQPGNPRPRLFRLPEDRALVNRMGFNNEGAAAVGERLDALDVDVPVGVNVGKNKSVDLSAAPANYVAAYERVSSADYVVVNVSSPNTPELRELQGREHLEAVLGSLLDAGARPLLVKLSPDLPDAAVETAVTVAEDLDLDGLVVTNTTTDRPDLASPNAAEAGGLSGTPIRERATEQVALVARRTDLPVVGVGGVATAEDAYEKLRAGARVVQLYTALVYRGPAVAREIHRGLLALLERDGFDSVTDAVGADL